MKRWLFWFIPGICFYILFWLSCSMIMTDNTIDTTDNSEYVQLSLSDLLKAKDALYYKKGETIKINARVTYPNCVDSLLIDIGEPTNINAVIHLPFALSASEPIQVPLGFSYAETGEKILVAKVLLKNKKILTSKTDTLKFRIGTAPRLLSKMIQVKPATITTGKNCTLGVAIDTATSKLLFCQWYRNLDSLKSPGTGTYILSSVNKNDEGFYRCKVSNPWGVDETLDLKLSVEQLTLPQIIIQPVSQEVSVGKSVTFVCKALSDDVTYQWYRDSVALTGEKSYTYTLHTVTTSDNGATFKCVASNGVGTVESQQATLTVSANETAPKISVQPKDATIAEDQSVSFFINASGSNLTYQWIKNDTVLPAETQSALMFSTVKRLMNQAKIRCIVSNSMGADTSLPATLTVFYTGTISIQADTTEATVGTEIKCKVLKNGEWNPSTLRYSWTYANTVVGTADSVVISVLSGTQSLEVTVTSNPLLKPVIASTLIIGEKKPTGKVVSVVTGASHTLILNSDASVWGFGSDSVGQLGLGGQVVNKTPVRICTDASAIACGSHSSFIIKKDGSVWGCGQNDNGQLGVGDAGNKMILTQIPIRTVSAVVCGEFHTLFYKKDGSVWGCGSNEYGQLGLGDTAGSFVITKITENAQMVSVGSWHSMVLKNDGTVFACGYNEWGQLGFGDTLKRKNLTRLTESVQSITCGRTFSFVLKKNGVLFGCGSNDYYQLGIKDAKNHKELSQIPETNYYTAKIACGGWHTLILRKDGSMWVAGYNEWGQLGLGNEENQKTFIRVADQISFFSAGWYHSMYVKTDGSLWASGRNNSGQLGTMTVDGCSHFIPIFGISQDTQL